MVLPSSLNKKKQTRPSLKTFLTMGLFIARMKIGAREWAKQEVVRKRLIAATEETKRAKRSHKLKVVRVDEQAC